MTLLVVVHHGNMASNLRVINEFWSLTLLALLLASCTDGNGVVGGAGLTGMPNSCADIFWR